MVEKTIGYRIVKILVVRHQTIVVMSLMKYLDVFRIMVKTAIYPQSTSLY